MAQIQDFFNKFEKIFSYQKKKYDTIQEVVFLNTKINVDPKQIQIIDGKIFLKIKPIQKSEILFKKEKILNQIKEKEGTLFKDIF